MPRSPQQRLTLRYIAALSAVALLCIVGQALVQFQLRQHAGDSHVVNLAGRQRMLSQQLAKSSLALGVASDAAVLKARLDELSATIELWQRSQEGLEKGDAALALSDKNSAAVRAMFAEVEPDYRAMLAGARSIVSIGRRGPPNSAADAEISREVSTILAHERPFLTRMDRIVFQYDEESAARVERLQRIELGLLAATLVVLAVEGAWIFRPAVARIRSTISRLRETSDELDRARRAAEAASQAKSDFLANISHEVRTPIHSVLGLTELALDGELPADARQHLATVHDSADALLRLLNDVLDLSKIEAGKLELDERAFVLRPRLRSLLDSFVPAARAKGIELAAAIDADVPASIVGDPDRLRQILGNLVGNAVKFTERGGVTLGVEVRSRTAERAQLRFFVEDTGIGIAADKLAAVFESFAQADVSTTRRYGGSGLGLTIAARLVRKMGGKLSARSQLGIGSTFEFDASFAVVVEEAEPIPAEHDPSGQAAPLLPAARSLRVLVVDDTPANQYLLTSALNRRGHRTVVASDGDEALTIYRSQPLDVIVLDVQMPRLDGLEVTRAIRDSELQSAGRPIYIVGMTAGTLRGDRQRCLAAGMDAYLAKPVGIRRLLEVIEGGAGCEAAAAANLLPGPADLPFDVSAALARLEGNEQIFAGLARMFLGDSGSLLAELRATAVAGDGQRLALVAHRIKGMAGNLAAEPTWSAAYTIETLAERGDTASIETTIDHLEQCLAELVAALEARGYRSAANTESQTAHSCRVGTAHHGD